jgi:IS4 transposase
MLRLGASWLEMLDLVFWRVVFVSAAMIFWVLTYNFALKPERIADLYRQRWQVELLFKWLKQHLRIKAFWGSSKNAVKTKIWIAVCSYVLIASVKKRLHLSHSLCEIL